MINISIQGNKAAIRGLQKAKREFTEYMEDNIQMLSDDIYAKSTSRVPVDLGFLKNSGYREVRGLNAEVGYSAGYSPYIEFGTGGAVDVPNGLEDYAIQFKGKNQKQVNLPARPYLFNSAFEETRLLIDKLRRDGVI